MEGSGDAVAICFQPTTNKGYLEMKSEVGAFWLTCSDLFDGLAACRTSDYSNLTCEMKRSRSLKQTCI